MSMDLVVVVALECSLLGKKDLILVKRKDYLNYLVVLGSYYDLKMVEMLIYLIAHVFCCFYYD